MFCWSLFVLLVLYLLVIVLSVLLSYTDFYCLVGILGIVLSVLLPYADSYCPVVSWALCCLFFFLIRIIIAPLVSFCHCVVCSSLIYGFWLHLWYLVAIVLSVLLWYTDSDYTFGILWPLCCLVLFNMRILIPPLVSCGHCVVCSSLIYGFWLHLWYIVAIALSVVLWYTDSDNTFGIFKLFLASTYKVPHPICQSSALYIIHCIREWLAWWLWVLYIVGSSHVRIKPKTIKLVFSSSPLSTQY